MGRLGGALALAAALGACSSENEIDLRLLVSPAVSDAELARVTQLDFIWSGAVRGHAPRTPTSNLRALREERIRILPTVGAGTFQVTVLALDDLLDTVATGTTGELMLGGRVSATVMLGPPAPPPPDLAVFDHAAPADLAVPRDLGTGVDLAVSTDLAPDLANTD